MPDGMAIDVNGCLCTYVSGLILPIWYWHCVTRHVLGGKGALHFQDLSCSSWFFDQADNANSGMWAGIAICGGGKVLKVTPEAHVVGEISFPNARMITCPAFVEDDLFITSAVEEEPAKFPDSVKFGGSLWKVHVGVKGMPVHKFRWR